MGAHRAKMPKLRTPIPITLRGSSVIVQGHMWGFMGDPIFLAGRKKATQRSAFADWIVTQPPGASAQSTYIHHKQVRRTVHKLLSEEQHWSGNIY